MNNHRRATSPQRRAIENMLARGTLTALNRARKMQRIHAKLLGGESKQSMEFFEQYGITSAPHDGAEILAAFIDGDRSHGVVICVADRRYRMLLEQGEVAIYDDLEQCVHLTRDGIVVEGKAFPIILKSTTKVRLETPLLECTGEIKDRCDSDGRTMEEMRNIYNGHNHITSPNAPAPNAQM